MAEGCPTNSALPLSVMRILLCLMALPLIGFFTIDFGDLVLKYRNTKSVRPSYTVYVPQQIVGRKDLIGTHVLILGGSSSRQFFGHEKELNDNLSKLCGRRIRAFNASSSSQSLGESLAAIEFFRKHIGEPDFIIMGLSLSRLSKPEYDHDERNGDFHLALPSPRSAYSWHEWPLEKISSISGAIRRITGLTPLLGQNSGFNSLGNHNADPPAPYANSQPLSLSRRKTLSVLANDQIKWDAAKHQGSLSSWLMAASLRAAGGIPTLFLLTPVSPSTLALSSPELDSPNLEMITRDLSAKVRFLDLRDAAALGLTDADFYDEQHLYPSGRESLWARPMPKLANLLCPKSIEER